MTCLSFLLVKLNRNERKKRKKRILISFCSKKNKHIETGHWQKRGTTGNPSPRAGHIALFWKENFFMYVCVCFLTTTHVFSNTVMFVVLKIASEDTPEMEDSKDWPTATNLRQDQWFGKKSKFVVLSQ